MQPWRTTSPRRSTSTTTTSSAELGAGPPRSGGPAFLSGAPDCDEEVLQACNRPGIGHFGIDVAHLVLRGLRSEEHAVVVRNHLVLAPLIRGIEPCVAEEVALAQPGCPVRLLRQVEVVHGPHSAVLVGNRRVRSRLEQRA